MNNPVPGKPVRGSKTGVPIMALFDLLGRRWAMGMLWTLCQEGPCTFRRLQELCDSVSPTLLNARLKDLRQAGLVERAEGGYQATLCGQELYGLLVPLGSWSKTWADRYNVPDLPASQQP